MYSALVCRLYFRCRTISAICTTDTPVIMGGLTRRDKNKLRNSRMYTLRDPTEILQSSTDVTTEN